MNRLLNILIPRLITEEVALADAGDHLEIACSMADVKPGERFAAVATVRTLNLFGLGLFPTMIGEPREWPGENSETQTAHNGARGSEQDLPPDMLQRLNEHMNGSQCPTEHSLGECAAIWAVRPNRFQAALYLWDDSFDDSTAVAEWFRALGARDISVCLTHFSDINEDRNGKTIDGGREWIVDFHMPTCNGSPSLALEVKA